MITILCLFCWLKDGEISLERVTQWSALIPVSQYFGNIDTMVWLNLRHYFSNVLWHWKMYGCGEQKGEIFTSNKPKSTKCKSKSYSLFESRVAISLHGVPYKQFCFVILLISKNFILFVYLITLIMQYYYFRISKSSNLWIQWSILQLLLKNSTWCWRKLTVESWNVWYVHMIRLLSLRS